MTGNGHTVIVAGARTPIGKMSGALAPLSAAGAAVVAVPVAYPYLQPDGRLRRRPVPREAPDLPRAAE